MVKHRRSGGNRTFPKRSVLWLPFNVEVELVSATSPVSNGNLLSNYFAQTGEEVPIGSTVGPIRGLVSLRPTTSTVFDPHQQVRAVIQVTPEGGRTQTADPDDDILDAMWYGTMVATAVPSESASGVFTQMPTTELLYTKAMRKITGNGQELILSAVSSNNADYKLRVVGNLLLKLP